MQRVELTNLVGRTGVEVGSNVGIEGEVAEAMVRDPMTAVKAPIVSVELGYPDGEPRSLLVEPPRLLGKDGASVAELSHNLVEVALAVVKSPRVVVRHPRILVTQPKCG